MHCNNWIFDMDGTLTDSMTVVWEGAPDALLARYGRTPKSDLHKTLLTMGMADGAAYLIREYDLPLKMEDYNDVMWDVITKLYETVELKPGVRELLARVRAALRTNRFGVLGGMPGGVFRAQGLEINYERRKVFVDSAEIKLTQTEYNIVAFLSEHAGRVMTYAAIVRAIWGDTDCGSTKKLQVNMANIRKKLGSVPGRNTYILNELGVGYRMIDEDTDARPES